MKGFSLALFGMVTAVMAAAVPVAAQAQQSASGAVKRTAWGDPDVQGVWDVRIQLPFQRPRNEKREFYTEAEVAAKEKSANAKQAEVNKQIEEGTFLALGDRCFPVDPGIFRDSTGGIDRPAQFSKRTSAIMDPPNGRLPPWTPAAMKRWEAREAATAGRGETDSWEDRGLAERCITRLAPANGSMSTTRILQFPGWVAITNLEIGHAGEGSMRVIPLDGRPKLGPSIRQWQGDSRGHFEGDTLVVEIANVNNMQTGGATVPHRTSNTYPGTGENLKVVERFRLSNANTLEYKVTVEDPDTYIRPYTAVRELTRDDEYEMQPMSCHEGHRSIGGALAQARADEGSALEYGLDIQKERKDRYEALKKEWAETYPELFSGSR